VSRQDLHSFCFHGLFSRRRLEAINHGG